MIYNAPDSDYYKKAARILHTLKYVTLLLLILLVVLGFTAYKSDITIENLRYLMRYADFDTGIDYMSYNQISFSASDDAKFGYIKGDLALISDNSFVTYDFTGEQLHRQKLSYLNPALKTSDKYALCYDVAGTGLSVFNSYSCIYSEDFEYGIRDADIRTDGSLALVTSGKYLSSRVAVLAPDSKEIFSWETRDKEAVSVSLSEKKDEVAFAALRAENGDFTVSLQLYGFESEQPRFAKEYFGEFPLKVYCFEGAVCMLTDKAIHFVAPDGSEISSFAHEQGAITGIFESGGFVAVTYAKSISRNSTMKLFTAGGREIGTDNFENNIISFSAYGNNVYALEKGKLHIRKINSEKDMLEYGNVSELSVDSLYEAVFAKSAGEYILVSPRGAGKFS